MIMPALLPERLRYCEKAESELALFELLKKYPPDLISFLETACADETWAESHTQFVKLGLDWAHNQFFQDSLMMEFAQSLAKVLRKHSSIARTHLPLNFTWKLKDKDLPANTLLYGTSSHYLKELIRLECRDRKGDAIHLEEIPFDVFMPVDQYITKGNVEAVYVKSKETVEAILTLSLVWNLPELGDECQRFLKKWINRDNIVDTLLAAHRNGWSILRSACMEYMNFLSLDFRLADTAPDRFGFEFLRFTEISLEFFNKFKAYITNLMFSGDSTADPAFGKVIHECPNLICLDLSYSHSFTDYLKEIPESLQELVASYCNWLNNGTFPALIQYCPSIEKLVIASDVNLNFETWGNLRKLSQLKSLDLSRCTQIGDEDIKLILQSCDTLLSLSVEECHGISDGGFYAIPLFHPDFVSLSFARTNISDQPLIEIANQCARLTSLDLTRCEKITEKGVLETVRAAKVLRELNITNCRIPETSVQKLKTLSPFLKIITLTMQ